MPEYQLNQNTTPWIPRPKLNGYGSSIKNFKQMYGRDAEFIDTTQVVPLAKTLNKMFATA